MNVTITENPTDILLNETVTVVVINEFGVDRITPLAIGFSISGGTVPKTLTVTGDSTLSGTNTGDISKATGTEVTTGTDNDKFVTPKAIKDAGIMAMQTAIHTATNKTTPVDADEVGIWDSISGLLNRLSWANIKATLKTYFDTLYLALVAPGTAGNVLTSDGTDWVSATPSGGDSTVKLRGFVSNPQAVYAQRAQIVIARSDAALTITRIHIHCSDTSPTAELAGDLKFADDINVGGFANATVIDVCDTTNGVVTITSGFDDATVPSGRYIYLQLDASPHSDIKDFYIEVFYTYD